jgi:hypothetical protein
MCEHHTFQFDENKAYEDQLISVLESSPKHPLPAPQAPRQPGIYVLFCSNVPVYVGKGKDLRSRLNDQSKKIITRKAINAQEITCRFLTINIRWKVLRAEATLRQRYNPKWNRSPRLSMHVPGRGRPGMPGYVNEWDKRFPPKKK